MQVTIPAPKASSLPGQSTQYDILWISQQNFLKNEIQRITSLPGKDFLLVDENVMKFHHDLISDVFSKPAPIIIPSGEKSKSFKSLSELSEKLAGYPVRRNDRLWAIGGGVTGDLTGFLASIYQRGIAFYQVPTTLLSMVDSSVGGKTGINLSQGKNMIGAFYRPCAVYIHTPFLETLPENQKLSGLAEVFKSAVIRSPALLRYLDDHVPQIRNWDAEILGQLSQMAIKVKAEVVRKDEQEKSLRAILNFGHTLGHAIEAFLNYKKLTHGEAVSIGMAYATYLSYQRNMITEKYFQYLLELQKNLGLPVSLGKIKKFDRTIAAKLVDLMAGDKKNIDDDLRFVLINAKAAVFPVKIPVQEARKRLEEFAKIF